MQSEIEIKTERLKKMLAGRNFGGVLIGSQHNFAWLTGGKSNAVNIASENGACFLFVRGDGKKFILANRIEMPRMLAEEVSADEFEPIEFGWQEEKISGDFIFEKAESLLLNPAQIVSDSDLNPKFKAVENLIAPCRYSLTEPEIERYRNLGRDAGIAVGKVFGQISAGASELEIARQTKHALAEYNIESVVTLIAADERIANFRHPVPTANIWKKVLLIVTCARRQGLIASLSRLACIGEIPAELQRKTEAAARVCAAVWQATTVGATGAELYETLKTAYAANGYAGEIDKHHQGGAGGYKPRDWVAHPHSAEIVFDKQAYAWNPTITGTKAEDTILVSDGGVEVLTASRNFPQIAVEIEGCEYFSGGILSL